MALWLKQSTAATILLGPFVDDTDGVTAETALTITQADVRLSKNGGNMAQKNEASAATHDELGYYDVALDATDTNTLGRLKVMVSESGALPVWQDFMVLPANTYDSLVSGSDALQIDLIQMNGNTAPVTNLEDDYDGTGYTKTNSTVGTVTTLTGHTAQTGDNYARLGAPAGVSVSADIAAVKTDTAATLLDTGTDGVIVATNNDKTGYNISGTLTTLDALDTQQDSQHSTTQAAIAGLENASVGAIADGVWDEAKAGHVGVGSFGEEVQAHGLSSEIAALNNFNPASDKVILSDATEAQIDAIETDTDTTIPALIAALNDLSAAQVNAEVLDVLNVDTFSELASIPSATPTITQMLRLLYALSRNKMTQNATTSTLRNDADGANIGTSTISDDGTTFTRGEWT